MLTLTKRGKFESIDACWAAFQEFSRLMKVRFGDRWKYVCVPELHSDGQTYHMHLAINGFFWADAVRQIWFRALGGKGNERGENTPGNVDITPPRKGRGWTRATRIRKLAGYISSYVGKGFTPSNRGRRLFGSSRGLDPDSVIRGTVRYWRSVPELVVALQAQVHGAGGAETGECYHWSRHRLSGDLMMHGFVLSTEWRN